MLHGSLESIGGWNFPGTVSGSRQLRLAEWQLKRWLRGGPAHSGSWKQARELWMELLWLRNSTAGGMGLELSVE